MLREWTLRVEGLCWLAFLRDPSRSVDRFGKVECSAISGSSVDTGRRAYDAEMAEEGSNSVVARHQTPSSIEHSASRCSPMLRRTCTISRKTDQGGNTMRLTLRGTRRLAVGVALVCGAILLPATAMVASATSGAPATVPRCAAASLVVWVGPIQGAAGSVAAEFGFTNHSSGICSLDGYPFVQMLNKSGKSLSTHDQRAPGAFSILEKTVILAPGKTAYFGLIYASQTGYGNLTCPTAARAEVHSATGHPNTHFVRLPHAHRALRWHDPAPDVRDPPRHAGHRQVFPVALPAQAARGPAGRAQWRRWRMAPCARLLLALKSGRLSAPCHLSSFRGGDR